MSESRAERIAAKVARDLDTLSRRVSKTERARDLRHSAIDAGGLVVIDPETGDPSWRLGPGGPEDVSGWEPDAPSLLAVTAGAGSLVVTWDGLTVAGDGMPAGRFRGLRVHLSPEPDFEPNDGTFAGSITVPGGSKTFAVTPGAWRVRGEIETTAGVVSVPGPVAEIVVPELVDEASIREALEVAREDLATESTFAREALSDLEGRLDTLNSETLPGLSDRMDDVDGDMTVLSETTLPALEDRLGTAEGGLSTLRSTDLPALDDALEDARERLGATFGQAENVIPDPHVKTDLWHIYTSGTVHHTGGRTAGMIELSAGANTFAFTLARDLDDIPTHYADGAVVPVTPGDVWEFTAWYRTSADYAMGGTNYSGLRVGNSTNGYILRPAGETALNTEWTKLTGRWTVPSGLDGIQVSIFQSHTAGTIQWADFSAQNVTGVANLDALTGSWTAPDSVEIDGGAIRARTITAGRLAANTLTAGEINASSIAGAVATFLQLNADQITAGRIGASQIDAEEIAGAVGTFLSLSADQIDSGKINAGQIDVTDLAAATASIQEVYTDNLIAGDAAMDTATANKIFADLAVVNRLQAESAWIGGALLEDGAITAEKITASESMSAKLAEFLAVTAGMIQAGAVRAEHLDIDHTDPNTGYRITVNATGIRLYDLEGFKALEISTDQANSFRVLDPTTGESLSSMEGGVVTAVTMNAEENVTVAGRDLLGADGHLWDTSWGIVDGSLAYRNISGLSDDGVSEWGFLQSSFPVQQGRLYRFNVEPWHVWDRDNGTTYVRLRRTIGSTAPELSDAAEWTQVARVVPGSGLALNQFGGQFFLRPDEAWFPTGEDSAQVNLMITIGNPAGFSVPNGLGEVTMWAEDIGPEIQTGGRNRNAKRFISGGDNDDEAAPAPVKRTRSLGVSAFRNYAGSNVYNWEPYTSSQMFQGVSPEGYGRLDSVAVFNGRNDPWIGKTVVSARVRVKVAQSMSTKPTIRVLGHGWRTMGSGKPATTSLAGKDVPVGSTVDIPLQSWALARLSDGTYDGIGFGDEYADYARIVASSVRLIVEYME